jgi:putative membrane protein
MNILVSLLIQTLAVIITAQVIPGVQIANFFTAVVTAVCMGLVNMTIKPLIVLFTLPVTIVTLGLFTFVINALMVLLVSRIVPGFTVDGFWSALWFSILLSLVSYFLNSLKS